LLGECGNHPAVACGLFIQDRPRAGSFRLWAGRVGRRLCSSRGRNDPSRNPGEPDAGRRQLASRQRWMVEGQEVVAGEYR
jgi:hypothetical protein